MPPSVRAKELEHRCDVFERQHRLMTLDGLDYMPASLSKVDAFVRNYYKVEVPEAWNHGMINIGCYVGEMVRRGLKGKWYAREPTQQSLLVNLGGYKLETNPFDAVWKVLSLKEETFVDYYAGLERLVKAGGHPPAPRHEKVSDAVAARAMVFEEPTVGIEVVSGGQGLIIGKTKDGREFRRILSSVDTEDDRETRATLSDRLQRLVGDKWMDIETGASRDFVLQVNAKPELVKELDLEAVAGKHPVTMFLFLLADGAEIRSAPPRGRLP